MNCQVYGCGFNAFHQLDCTTVECQSSWVRLDIFMNEDACMTLSWDSFYSQDSEGHIHKNGKILPLPPQARKGGLTALSSSEDHLVALHSDGSVMLFKDGEWRHLSLQSAADSVAGQVCHVDIGRQTLAACDSEGNLRTLDAVPTPPGEHVVSVACGREHVVLLTRSGRVYTYGGGSRGQLGTGELGSAELPQLVAALDGLRVCQVAAGGWHSAAVSSSGDLYTWGWNEANQLGLGADVNVAAEPLLVEALPADTSVREVSCGSRHTLVLLEDGAVLGWGWNGHGQLAGPPCEAAPPGRLAVPAGRVLRIAAGGWSSAVVVAGRRPPASGRSCARPDLHRV